MILAENFHLTIGKKVAFNFLDVLRERTAKNTLCYPTEQAKNLLCKTHR